MDQIRRRAAARPACSPAQPAPHQIVVCEACKHQGQSCGPGYALLQQLRAAVALAGVDEAFEISGTACLVACGRPCTVAWRATGTSTWYFGDVDPEQPIADLVEFARHPAAPGDALARVPAAMIMTREGAIQ